MVSNLPLLKQRSAFLATLLACLFLLPFSGNSQEIPDGIALNNNKVFQNSIHTVLLYPNGFDQADPIIELNGNAQLFLAFDDFSNDVKNYRYTVVHCDHDWKASEINSFEYIQGFEEVDISNYQFSRNTSFDYVHYETVFPNDDIQITKSGNYVIVVYDETLEKENIAFIWQFRIYDPLVSVGMKVEQSRLSVYRNSHQEIKVMVNARDLNLVNPESTVFMEVQQNGRKDNIIKGLKPRLFLNNILHYDNDDEILFQGGNEFRGFDIRSFRVNAERVHHVEFDQNTGNHIYLFQDINRRRKPYVNDDDLNGRKAIATEKRYDPQTEGDYGWVHFELPYHVPLPNSKVYIIGGVNDWDLDFKSEMTYDFHKKAYVDSLFLKQGYYNYLYGVLEKGKKSADLNFFEGSHQVTKNEYKVFIYYREPGTIYDQLIGYDKLETPQ